VSFWFLFLLVKLWRPKTIRGFGGTPLKAISADVSKTSGLPPEYPALLSWLPYIVLIFVVVAWTGPWSRLPSFSLFKLSVAAQSSVTHTTTSSVFNFTPFGAGTSILGSFLIILAILRPSGHVLRQVFARTAHQMWGAWLVGFFIFGLAYIFVYTGMANSLAYGLSKIGVFFIVLSPILGWIGVALSGSNVSTNAMFGPVQAMTGRLLHLPPLLLPSFNSVGAEVGKPIAPQTASVGVSTSRLVREEGEVIRHNLAWTLIILAYLILIAVLFYWVFPKAISF
jgi:lactate permease